MNALVILILNIMRLRAAPQDLPHSRFLMLLSVTSYLLMGLVIALLDQTFGLALLSAGVDTGMLIGLAYLGLWVRNFKGRFVQMAIALCSTGVLFGLLSWPLKNWFLQFGENPPSILWFLLLALFIWVIAVIGHILRHALEIPLWLGAGISLLYIYNAIRVMVALQIAGTTMG